MACKNKCIGQCICSIKKHEDSIGDRWEKGMDHHPKSIQLMEYLESIDYHIYNDSFCWKTGGDGDNGETLMFQMDVSLMLKIVVKFLQSKNKLGHRSNLKISKF